MKNLLLPIDFYEDSRPVLRDLLSFLNDIEGHFKVFLLSTYMVPISSPDRLIPTHDELRSQSLERLKKGLRTAKELAPNGKVSFETTSQIGFLMNVMSRIVSEEKIDGIIVHASRDSNREEVMSLSNRIHCPVIVLPSSHTKIEGMQTDKDILRR